MNYQTTSIEQAFVNTGRDIAVLELAKKYPAQDVEFMDAQYCNMVVTEAINMEDNNGEKWTPSYDGKERKYELYVWLKNNPPGVGFVVYGTGYDYACTLTDCGSRLCFKTYEGLDFFRTHFLSLLEKRMTK